MLKKVAVLGLVLFGLLAGSAQATATSETRKVAQEAVASTLAASLAFGDSPAPHKVYGCDSHSCAFWVKGTSDCTGTVQVRDGATEYRVWFSRLQCQVP